MHRSLRDYLSALRADRDLVEIDAEVDARLEIAEIHRRVIAEGGPALLFKRVRGSRFPVVTNLFGTTRRVERAFGARPEQFVRELAAIPRELMPPTPAKLWAKRGLIGSALRVGMRRVRRAPAFDVHARPPRLTELPALTSAPDDGGAFITLPLVYTEHPDAARHESNLGMYRLHIFDDRTSGFHAQIGKGGGFHYHAAELRGEALPVSVFLGGPPALILAAIAPLPEGVPEMMLASLVLGERLDVAQPPSGGHRAPAQCEFVLRGRIPPRVRRIEGPFGDHYGYYSLAHEYPVVEYEEMWHRRDAIYPATVVGKPKQEDYYLGDFLQKMLSPLFPVVMPAVVDLWSYGDTGYHSLAAAVVKDRYGREALSSAFRILGEGQLSLTKFLLLTDARRDLTDFKGLLEHLLACTRFETDLFIFSNVSMDTLDYTGPKVNEGSKGVWLALGPPVRELPRAFEGSAPAGARDAAVYCAGCVVVSGPSYAEDATYAARLARDPAVARWPLVILADDARGTAATTQQFLWRVFTRFEPGADVYAKAAPVVRHHPAYEPPIVIDARMKPWFPGEVDPDAATTALVDRRWREYFPGK